MISTRGVTRMAVVAAMVLLAAGAVQAVITIDKVTVGNPGNAPDTEVMNDGTTGYGAVVYTFNMGKFEVTAGQYTAFLNAVAATDTYGLYSTSMWSDSWGCKINRTGSSGNYTYSVASDWANRPVSHVSWGDSARFANWLTNDQHTGGQDLTTTEDGSYYLNGATTDAALMAVTVPNASQRALWASGLKRYFLIPSEDEWYKAAYYDPNKPGGPGYWNYQTGSDTVPGRDMADASGNNANYYSGGYLIGSPYYRTEVGEFQNSDSPYGTFDQGGNVWEWNEAILYGSERGVRGGSFGCTYYDGGLRAALRYDAGGHPTNEAGSMGFRISEVPEPATLALLALGGLALLRRSRR